MCRMRTNIVTSSQNGLKNQFVGGTLSVCCFVSFSSLGHCKWIPTLDKASTAHLGNSPEGYILSINCCTKAGNCSWRMLWRRARIRSNYSVNASHDSHVTITWQSCDHHMTVMRPSHNNNYNVRRYTTVICECDSFVTLGFVNWPVTILYH